MNLLRTLFHRTDRRAPAAPASRFARYYGDVVRTGAGYPTADEARRDLARFDRTVMPHGWFR